MSALDINRLYSASDQLMKDMKDDLPGLLDVNSDLQVKNLQLNINIDRQKCAILGITMQQVQDALNSAYSQRQVSVIYTPTNQYWVILEVDPKYYQDASMLGWLEVRTSAGELVPLSTVSTIERSVGPQQVNHLGQFPSVTISFNMKPGAPLGEAVSQVTALAKKTLPPDVSFSFQGTAQQYEQSVQNLGALLVIAILVIYIVLGILYESFIHPLTILSGLPSAGLGAILSLLIFNLPLDIYGFLGLVLLIGIVKKNAIMMIDFAVDYQRTHDSDAHEAIFKASVTRFRPIIMTTMAALLGSVPIALNIGGSSDSRVPLGTSIVGGLLVSQLVTLYITPVFYIYLDRFQKHLARKAKMRQVPEQPSYALE
jgi:HAE1 family hydrophobic/amphiphilic exporter-1